MEDEDVIEAGSYTVQKEMAKLNPEFGSFDPPHWRPVRACSFGIKNGERRVWVSLDGRWRDKENGHMQWFDTLQEADAWLFACWRMK